MTLHLHLARCRTPPVPTYTCLLHASPHPTTSARAINEPSQSFPVPREGPYKDLTIKNLLGHYDRQAFKHGKYIDVELKRLSAKIIIYFKELCRSNFTSRSAVCSNIWGGPGQECVSSRECPVITPEKMSPRYKTQIFSPPTTTTYYVFVFCLNLLELPPYSINKGEIDPSRFKTFLHIDYQKSFNL